MPRLPQTLLKAAHCENPLLVLLLKSCRDLNSARRELSWIRQYVNEKHKTRGTLIKKWETTKLCRQRSQGNPLQYLLRTEFFGQLELRCITGVLIPRPETAAMINFLAWRVLGNRRSQAESNFVKESNSVKENGILRVLDICTGTGCMSLLLSHLLGRLDKRRHIRTVGVDISARAVSIARRNLLDLTNSRGIAADECEIDFIQANALDPDFAKQVRARSDCKHFDVVISNPPYVSQSEYWSGQTSKSVRKFEPLLALVPSSISGDATGDEFYPPIFETASKVGAKVVMVEVGGTAQALRVAEVLSSTNMNGGAIEIWRDGIDVLPRMSITTSMWMTQNGLSVSVLGDNSCEARAVVYWTGSGASSRTHA